MIIETERFLAISRSSSLYSLCPVCDDEVRMVTVDQAAALACVTWREIYCEVEAGNLHFIDTGGRSLLICLHSLNDSNRKQKG
jgi:hypothetical protein